MQKMKVIELSRFEKREAKWRGSQPFTMCFCYPKSGPVIVKGMKEEVIKYVENKIGPCHYRYTYFKDGKPRGAWSTNIHGVYISSVHNKKGRQRYCLYFFKNHKLVKKYIIRRIPLKYLKEFDTLI